MNHRTTPTLFILALGALTIGACKSGQADSSQPPSTGQTQSQNAQPPRAGKDAQSTYEPRSEPGEGQKFLARMSGEWTVVKTFYPRGGGDPSVTNGTCTQKMIHAGRFLESDFVFNDRGGDSDGMGVIGFDPANGAFTSFWTDSRSTRISVRQSEAPFDGKQIVLFSKTIGEPDKNTRRSRTVSVLEDGDRKLIHRQYSDSPEGEARLVMQLEMTRKN